VNGLPVNDIRSVAATSAGCYAATGQGVFFLPAHSSSPTSSVALCAHAPAGEEIRSLLTTPGGQLWVASTGGLYHLRASQATESGAKLSHGPAGSAWRLAGDGASVWAAMQKGLLCLSNGRLFLYPPASAHRPPVTPPVTALRALSGRVLLATALGFWQMQAGQWTFIPLPVGSSASHVSAISSGAEPVAALYGDGLYRLAGARWEKLSGIPSACQMATGVEATKGGYLVGTHAGGVWSLSHGCWTQLQAPHAIPQGDIYAIAEFHGRTWAATFDAGLICLDKGHIECITRGDGPSANTPRGLLVYRGSLFVRYASGQIDRFDGNTWAPAFTLAEMRRPEVYSFATDGHRLYLGGCGGWSATNGNTWERHYDEPGLVRQVVTAIAAEGDSVWVGTQGQGVLYYQGTTVARLAEASGLTDDWITCLAARHGRVLAGTYTGGLLEWKHGRFHVLFNAENMAIRAVDFLPGSNQALAATPLGLYRETGAGWRVVPPGQTAGIETQAICSSTGGIWIGGRTGLAFVPTPAMPHPM
jgi:hypothetical protein